VVIGTVGDMGTHSSSRRLAEVIKLHPELQMVLPLLAPTLSLLPLMSAYEDTVLARRRPQLCRWEAAHMGRVWQHDAVR
jgi:hypothetical protein